MTTSVLERARPADVCRTERTFDKRCDSPPVDILESADEWTVFVDMPGVKNDSVDVNLDNGRLTIQGGVESRRPEESAPLLTEFGGGDYHRVFQVSEKIDSARITAELANGVLTLHLPKGEAIKPRKIALVAK